MSTPANSPVGMMQLLAQSWRIWHAHARTFLTLMALPIAFLVFGSVILIFFVLPGGPVRDLRETWEQMAAWHKVLVFVIFFGSLAVEYRALAASVFLTREIREGRELGVLRSLRFVRRKHLRLFWLLILAGLLASAFGPSVGPFVSMILGFFCAPAFPAAILENLGAFRALERGNELTTGGQGRIALLYLSNLVLVVAATLGMFSFVIALQERLGRAWYLRPLPALMFWVISLIPQFYMVVLTLNYFDQRIRKGEGALAPSAPAPAI